MALTKNPIFSWNTLGDLARIADTSGSLELVITVGPGHLKMSHARGKPHKIVRFMTFSALSGRQLPDEVKKMTPAQIATAFNIPRTENVNDAEFAKLHDAEFGIPNMFVRQGNQLILIKTTEMEGPHFSIFLYPPIKRKIELFLQQKV